MKGVLLVATDAGGVEDVGGAAIKVIPVGAPGGPVPELESLDLGSIDGPLTSLSDVILECCSSSFSRGKIDLFDIMKVGLGIEKK